MDFIFLALCIVVLIFAIFLHQQYTVRQKFKNFPQIDAYPIVGVAIKLARLSHYVSQTCKEEILLFWVVSKPFIFVYKPEHLEQVFPSTVNITKGEEYDMLRPWLGNGLLTSTGKQWFHDRKLIGPTFHFRILDQFAVVLSEKAEILIKCLEREIERDSGKAVDVFPLIVNAALDVICETAMGVNIRAQETVTKYHSTVDKASASIMNRLLTPWYWPDWLYYFLPVGKKFKSTIDLLHDFTKGVINKKKAERQSQNGYTDNEDNELNIGVIVNWNYTSYIMHIWRAYNFPYLRKFATSGKRKRKAFLDLLLDQNAKDDTPLTDDELRAQVDTFMFEGHDTTAVAMTWALFLLGNNLEQQEKVHEELDEIFGDSDTPASVKELSQLKYLERVIKETLRLFPSVPIITRKLTEDVKLDNYTLSKGLSVTLAILFAHRNPKVWPDPMKFDPDRFLPENSKDRNPYAYVPFSAGPRNCIGQRFALLEEKIMLAAILRKWRVKSVKTLDTIEYGGTLILRPCEEVLIHFTSKK
ncbi:cytochrome P450 4C1-like isoform X2 [Temnothorax longispinosus]|uniref:cytochrome P450 4C1-like isoform X2 n=1 Tax=Temnothorax longispinosus TaxID=300112 RepID=UPI003A9A0E2F